VIDIIEAASDSPVALLALSRATPGGAAASLALRALVARIAPACGSLTQLAHALGLARSTTARVLATVDVHVGGWWPHSGPPPPHVRAELQRARGAAAAALPERWQARVAEAARVHPVSWET
jgi:hypothetical protein